MEIRTVAESDKMRINVSGSIDELGAQKLEDCISKLDIRSVKDVTLDFKQVAYIGSAGVGILLLLYKKVALQNGKILIQNIPKEIYSLLADEMNLGQVFTLSRL